jgi:hypothetical protein
MSLLSDAMENCTMLDRKSTPDATGGVKYEYVEGATFEAAIVYDSSIQARIGGAQGVTALYTVTTKKNINLQYHQVFRREGDGKTFRVTSDGDDNKTPKSAMLDMRQVNAEEFKL